MHSTRTSPAFEVRYGGIKAILDGIQVFRDYQTLIEINNQLLKHQWQMNPGETHFLRVMKPAATGKIVVYRIVEIGELGLFHPEDKWYDTTLISPPVNLRKELLDRGLKLGIIPPIGNEDPAKAVYGENFSSINAINKWIDEVLKGGQSKNGPVMPPLAKPAPP